MTAAKRKTKPTTVKTTTQYVPRTCTEEQRREAETNVSDPIAARLMGQMRARRKQLGITVESLAYEARVGLRTFCYMDQIQARGRTHLGTFIRIAKALGYELVLVERQDPTERTPQPNGR